MMPFFGQNTLSVQQSFRFPFVGSTETPFSNVPVPLHAQSAEPFAGFANLSVSSTPALEDVADHAGARCARNLAKYASTSATKKSDLQPTLSGPGNAPLAT